jgi:hypothetical protein
MYQKRQIKLWWMSFLIKAITVLLVGITTVILKSRWRHKHLNKHNLTNSHTKLNFRKTEIKFSRTCMIQTERLISTPDRRNTYHNIHFHPNLSLGESETPNRECAACDFEARAGAAYAAHSPRKRIAGSGRTMSGTALFTHPQKFTDKLRRLDAYIELLSRPQAHRAFSCCVGFTISAVNINLARRGWQNAHKWDRKSDFFRLQN